MIREITKEATTTNTQLNVIKDIINVTAHNKSAIMGIQNTNPIKKLKTKFTQNTVINKCLSADRNTKPRSS